MSLLVLMFRGTDLNATFQHGPILDADALGHDITCQRTLAADVQAIGALDVPLYLAHDHNLAGSDVRGDDAVASNGDAVIGKIDGTLNPAIDVERFGAADFTLDYKRAANRSLLHGRAYGLERRRVWVRRKLRFWRIVLCWLQHRFRPSFVPAASIPEPQRRVFYLWPLAN